MHFIAEGGAMTRPSFIKSYKDIVEGDDSRYPGSDELLSIGSPFGKALGLSRLGIHHEELPPGRRTSWPHAESDEEEFVYVIEGQPEVWIDGEMYPLVPGDGVGFPAGTGIAHTFINNTDTAVRLLVVGEATKKSNRIIYPLHPERNAQVAELLWREAPNRQLGAHDGLPDRHRERKKGRVL